MDTLAYNFTYKNNKTARTPFIEMRFLLFYAFISILLFGIEYILEYFEFNHTQLIFPMNPLLFYLAAI